MLRPPMLRYAICALTVLLTGCATVVEGTTQSVSIVTDPPGASCVVSRLGERIGMVSPTPGSLHLDKSKDNLTVTCTLDGYERTKTTQSPNFKATTFGNIIAGGLVGVAVDAASGADYAYPTEVRLAMAPGGTQSPVAETQATGLPASDVVPSAKLDPPDPGTPDLFKSPGCKAHAEFAYVERIAPTPLTIAMPNDGGWCQVPYHSRMGSLIFSPQLHLTAEPSDGDVIFTVLDKYTLISYRPFPGFHGVDNFTFIEEPKNLERPVVVTVK